MKKLGVSLGLLAVLGMGLLAHAQTPIGPSNTILCNQMASTVQTGTGSNVTTSIINGVAGKIVVICGWHVTESGTTAGTFQLAYGTQGGPCGAPLGPVNLTPAFSVSSTAPATDHVDWASLSIPSGAQLCVVTGGAATSTMQIGVWTAQF